MPGHLLQTVTNHPPVHELGLIGPAFESRATFSTSAEAQFRATSNKIQACKQRKMKKRKSVAAGPLTAFDVGIPTPLLCLMIFGMCVWVVAYIDLDRNHSNGIGN